MSKPVLRLVMFCSVLGLRVTSTPAQTPVYDYKTPLLERCLNGHSGDKILTIDRCAKEEHVRQTRRMLTALAALNPLMDGWQRKRLRQVQGAWERWKDLRCSFIDDEKDPGVESHSEAEDCLANTTAERADELLALRLWLAPGTQP